MLTYLDNKENSKPRELSVAEQKIRAAVVEDAPAIAQVHVESSKTTYRGIFPESLLDRLSVSDRTAFGARPSQNRLLDSSRLWLATKREEL